MTVVAVGSIRGAPGVTSTALLLAGSFEDGAIAEADLDGGVVAVRYRLGREPGLTTLAAAHSLAPEDWREHAQDAGGVPVLVGPDAPDRMDALWSRAGQRIASSLAASTGRVVVDGGRLRPCEATAELLAAASATVLLVRPVPEDLVGLAHRLPSLRHAAGLALVLVGQGVYSPGDIEAEFGLGVLGNLPADGRAASMLSSGGSARGLARTRLARAVRTIADGIADRMATSGAPGVGTYRIVEAREEADA